jgi:hypothetical protein
MNIKRLSLILILLCAGQAEGMFTRILLRGAQTIKPQNKVEQLLLAKNQTFGTVIKSTSKNCFVASTGLYLNKKYKEYKNKFFNIFNTLHTDITNAVTHESSRAKIKIAQAAFAERIHRRNAQNARTTKIFDPLIRAIRIAKKR